MPQEDKFKTYYNDLHWSLTEYDRVVMEVRHSSIDTSWHRLITLSMQYTHATSIVLMSVLLSALTYCNRLSLQYLHCCCDPLYSILHLHILATLRCTLYYYCCKLLRTLCAENTGDPSDSYGATASLQRHGVQAETRHDHSHMDQYEH